MVKRYKGWYNECPRRRYTISIIAKDDMCYLGFVASIRLPRKIISLNFYFIIRYKLFIVKCCFTLPMIICLIDTWFFHIQVDGKTLDYCFIMFDYRDINFTSQIRLLPTSILINICNIIEQRYLIPQFNKFYIDMTNLIFY